ncbi:hypothetical protein [Phenylobacterium sp.]|uniref:hypothetical protein n=1 Tax=Phenylobacterium sp. TaxID=1871053 RepID=UPI0035626C2F
MRLRLPPLLIAAALAPPAWAQPATPPPAPRDVIGALLDHRGQQPTDEDEPDTASAPRAAPEPEPVLTPQAGAVPYVPAPRPHLDAPVHLEETGKTADAPPTPRDMAYEARIRSSFASAEGFQGPLDGGWTLTADGQDLYALQLVDQRDRLEGVWRDMRRKGSINASGLVDDIQRQGSEVTLRFTPAPGAPTTVATLHGGADGRWTGELAEGGARRPVTLRRSGPY